MAGQPRDRASRAGRKNRAVRAGPGSAAAALAVAAAAAAAPPASDPDPSGVAAGEDAAPWGRATADELEDRLLRRLEEAYAAALARLADLGYCEEAALHAVLRAGHCYGKLGDPVANIVANARVFLSDPDHAGGAGGFADLRRLEEYSLAGLVCLLQSSRLSLSRAEAMWCLLSCDLRLDQAISMGASLNEKPTPAIASAESDEVLPPTTAAVQHGYCHYHTTTASATPDTARFDPDNFMRLAMCQGPGSVSGVISCIKTTWSRTNGTAPDAQAQADQQVTMKLSTEEIIDSIVKELKLLDIDKKDTPDVKPDPKNEMVRDLIKQTREMEAQLKERKEWAQQKAIQAARKLGTDLTELRVLRMQHDENQRRKKDKQEMEDETMKRLTQLENELKKKSGQLDRSNGTVQKLEMENAEIRAEMEAAKLSASESERQCQKLVKKEKKDSKRLEMWDRQKAKLQEDIAECKAKITQADRELAEVNKAIRNMES
ncbi:hypothetical protein E2562_033365 [Oryza meyeriana var. granulata]|uniref:PIR2-like helical domain-containing protein n=1 Tax=Oryza meyeriana var. granulata TaxID=110450 RepID=A0A6G1C307_9ORYZ|nr:hypothetical protein E2562_033365 [Oryza meyeriana var. granulata]